MKRTRTRVLSLLLACTMLFSIVPMTALAEDDDQTTDTDVVVTVSDGEQTQESQDSPETVEDEPLPVTSGNCGMQEGDSTEYSDSVKWNYNAETGELTISGEGKMADFPGSSYPWKEYCDQISSISIEEGVTYIGATSFQHVMAKTISILSTVVEMAEMPFGKMANLEKIVVDSDNPIYCSTADGILLTKDGTVLIKYPSKNTASAYEVPEGVETIAPHAISYAENLKTLALPEGLKKIGRYSIQGTTAITELTIPASVDELENYAFYDNASLREVAIESNLSKISESLFNNCISLETVTFKNPDAVAEIGKSAFYKCEKLETLNLKSVQKIDSNAFGGCSSITTLPIDFDTEVASFPIGTTKKVTSIRVPDSITDLLGSCFNGWKELKSVEFSENSKIETIGNGAFRSTGLEYFKFPSTIKRVGNYAFQDNTLLDVIDLTALSDDTIFTSAVFVYNPTVTPSGSENQRLYYTATSEMYNKIQTGHTRSNLSRFAITNGGMFNEDTEFSRETLATSFAEGWNFKGWYTDADFQTAVTAESDGTYKTENQKVYYAKLESQVTFDANGGTGDLMSPLTITCGKATTLSENTYTGPNGYMFSGWNTEKDGSGTHYDDKESVTFYGPTALYAEWHKDVGESTYDVVAILDQVYTGKPIEPTIVVKTEDGTILEDGFTTSFENNTDVTTGESPAKVTIKIGRDSVKVTFNIVQDKNPTIEMAGFDINFDGEAHPATATAYTSAGNEIADAEITIQYFSDAECTAKIENAAPTAANTYYAKATLTGTDNYAGTESDVVTIKILPIDFKLSVTENAGLIYNGKTQALVTTEKDEGVTVTYSLSADGAYTAEIPAVKDAGTYTVYYKAAMENHNSAEGSVQVTIAPAVLTAAYVSESIKKGNTPALEVEVTGFVGGETAETAEDYVAPTVSNDSTEVGEYTLTPEGGSAKNYTFKYEAGTLIIRKKSTSGGSSSSSKDYAVSIDSAKNGKVTVSPKSADKGDTVTITVTPDKGYEVDEVIVTDKNGKELTVKDKGDGKYTFTMPASKVSIEVSFARERERTIVLTLGSTAADVFGTPVVNDVAPIARNNRTMLPIRFVAEALGARVDWDQAQQKVTITKGNLLIEIFLNSDVAYVNGQPVQLDSPAFAENSRTYLPLRFVAENLGATVEWEQATQRVIITVD